MQYESERIEYKSQLTDEIYKEVIAFANTDGGIIYIGVDDQGNATGIDDVDGTYTRLTNGVRDATICQTSIGSVYIVGLEAERRLCTAGSQQCPSLS